MTCSNCGNQAAYRIRARYWGDRKEESCDHCGVFGSSMSFSDVYWPGPHSIEHVTDDKGKPIFFETKVQKANVFREQKIREAGDRIHGAREQGMHRHRRYRRPPNPSLAHETNWRA